jgi:hypothetical protein
MKEFPSGSIIWVFGNDAKFCLNLVFKVKILKSVTLLWCVAPTIVELDCGLSEMGSLTNWAYGLWQVWYVTIKALA